MTRAATVLWRLMKDYKLKLEVTRLAYTGLTVTLENMS